MDRAAEVIDFFREFTASAPDELGSLLMLRMAPAAPSLPPEVHGAPVAGIAVCYAGPVEDGAAAVRKLKAFGSPLVDLVAPKPFRPYRPCSTRLNQRDVITTGSRSTCTPSATGCETSSWRMALSFPRPNPLCW